MSPEIAFPRTPLIHIVWQGPSKKKMEGASLYAADFFLGGGGVYTFSVLVFSQGSWGIPGRLDAYGSVHLPARLGRGTSHALKIKKVKTK